MNQTQKKTRYLLTGERGEERELTHDKERGLLICGKAQSRAELRIQLDGHWLTVRRYRRNGSEGLVFQKDSTIDVEEMGDDEELPTPPPEASMPPHTDEEDEDEI